MDGMELAGIAAILWYILQVIGCWKLFRKAGIPGWHSIVPILNIIDEYRLCWSGGMGMLFFLALTAVNCITPASLEGSGVVMAVAAALVFVIILLQIIESGKLAKAFGKGLGFTLILIIFDRLGRLVLGLGSAEYIGKGRNGSLRSL